MSSYLRRHLWIAVVLLALPGRAALTASVFPAAEWEMIEPTEAGLDAAALAAFVEAADSGINDGAIVYRGRMVASWGAINEIQGWASAWKPQNSMALFFLIQDGALSGVEEEVAPFVPEAYDGTELIAKDRSMTFAHLANQTSGYSFLQEPGASFSYNDAATATASKLLTAVVRRSDPERSRISYLAERLAPIGLQDGLASFMSVRDQCRLAWWWLNEGAWDGQQLLAASFFDRYVRPLVPRDLPASSGADPNGAYLGSVGVRTGYDLQGVYGYWWWFNNRPVDDADFHNGRFEDMFDGLPNDAYAAVGYGRKYVIAIPRLEMVVAINSYAGAYTDWSHLAAAARADVTPPSETVVPDAALDGRAVTLSWDPASDAESGVDAYYLYRDGAFLVEVGATSYRDASAVAGATHRYQVQAFNASGFASAVGPAATIAVPVADDPPTITSGPSADPALVTGTSTELSVTATDDGGAAGLTYTWTASGPASVSFSANGTNDAAETSATFLRAGDYTFTVEVRDADGGSASDEVDLTVEQRVETLRLSP